MVRGHGGPPGRYQGHHDELMAAAGMDRVVLFGASDAARVVLEQLEGSGVRVAAIVDEQRAGTECRCTPLTGSLRCGWWTWRPRRWRCTAGRVGGGGCVGLHRPG